MSGHDSSWAAFADDAIERLAKRSTSRKIADVLRRLCAARGPDAVGDAVLGVYSARDNSYLPLSRRDARRRAAALCKLDEAVRRVLHAPRDSVWGDDELRRRLVAVLPLIGAASRAPRSERRTFRTRHGWDRRSLERAFRRLGASQREAVAIVSALEPPPDGLVTTTVVL